MDGVVPKMIGMTLSDVTPHLTPFHLGGCHLAFGGPTFHLGCMTSPFFELDVTHLEHDVTLLGFH
jgi:hypothetical protein